MIKVIALLPLLAACATPNGGQLPANAQTCTEPRPQLCTMDYNPVCATRDSGTRCVTTPCPAREQATYANACGACADARVFYHLPGAC